MMKETSTVPIARARRESDLHPDKRLPEPGKSPVTIKDFLLLAYLYPLRFAASRLGAANLHRLGRAIGPLFRLLMHERRRAAEAVMALAEGVRFTNGSIRDTSGQFLSNAILRALDDLTMFDHAARNRMTPPEIHGLAHLQAALARGKGVLLTSGHFYANRLAKFHLAQMGYPVVSVRNRLPRDRRLGKLGVRFVQPRYVDFVHQIIGEELFIQDPECSLKMFKHLRAGRIVNVHIDAGFASRKTRLPFLGQQRTFSMSLLEIVRLSGCAVLPMLCLGNQRKPSIHFDEPISFLPAVSAEEFALLNLPALVAKLERQIKEYPEQWELWTRL
jgi:lauroyl/myristoyl acyltransferase